MNTQIIMCNIPVSAFEKWWSDYHITNDMIDPKQVACDAYAAGMADPMVNKTPENNPPPIPLSGTL